MHVAPRSFPRGITAGAVNGKLVVKTGQTIELASTAKINGPVTVEPGGALDVQGAKITGPVTAKQAARLQLCGASVTGPVRATNGSGRIVIGEGIPGCAASVIAVLASFSALTTALLYFDLCARQEETQAVPAVVSP
jgi:hypothetical protein